MKKNAIASIALAFATAYVLAAPDGAATRVGELSRSSDYVYTAVQADTMIHAARDAANAYTTAVSNKLSVAATTTTAGLMSAADKTKLDGLHKSIKTVSAGNNYFDFTTGEASWLNIMGSGAVSSTMSDNTVTISVSDASTSAKGVVQLSSSTNGTSTAKAATESAVKDAIAGAKAYADAKAASVAYVHPTYTARTGKPTADATPSFGGTFTVSQITSDSTGHVTGATDRTITIPTLPTASTSAAGIVQLSTSTNGTSTAKAATESAVKAALDGAKAYADTKASAGVTKSAIATALQAQGLSAAIDTAASLDDMDTIAAKLAAVIAVLDALD